MKKTIKAPLQTISMRTVKANRKKLVEFVGQVKSELVPMQQQAALFPERDVRTLDAIIPVRNIRRSIDSLLAYADMMAFLLEQIDGDIVFIKARQKHYIAKKEAEAARIAAEREARKAEREAQKAAEQEINN